MPGPGKKPPNLKAISGTARKDREAPPPVDLPLVTAIPEAPEWLPNAHAVNEWNRLAPLLHANKLLTEVALSPLAHLCALHGKIVQLWAAGEAPTGHLYAQYRALVMEFGMTPVAQGKVQSAGEKPKGNKFAQIGKPRAS